MGRQIYIDSFDYKDIQNKKEKIIKILKKKLEKNKIKKIKTLDNQIEKNVEKLSNEQIYRILQPYLKNELEIHECEVFYELLLYYFKDLEMNNDMALVSNKRMLLFLDCLIYLSLILFKIDIKDPILESKSSYMSNSQRIKIYMKKLISKNKLNEKIYLTNGEKIDKLEEYKKELFQLILQIEKENISKTAIKIIDKSLSDDPNFDLKTKNLINSKQSLWNEDRRFLFFHIIRLINFKKIVSTNPQKNYLITDSF